MSYRILVSPSALRLLRELSDHVVQRAGQVLAEIAELAGANPRPALAFARPGRGGMRRLDLENASVFYKLDPRERTLTVLKAVPRKG